MVSIKGIGGGTKSLREKWSLRRWLMLSWLKVRMIRRDRELRRSIR